MLRGRDYFESNAVFIGNRFVYVSELLCSRQFWKYFCGY